MEWMAGIGFSLGRPLEGDIDERYWPVPPLGVYTTWRVITAFALRSQP
jgi:hypothetical protein